MNYKVTLFQKYSKTSEHVTIAHKSKISKMDQEMCALNYYNMYIFKYVIFANIIL